MSYSDGGSIIRGDLRSVVQEARNAEKLLIGLRVFPEYGVGLRTDQYPKFRIAKGKLLNRESTKRAPDGSYGEIRRSHESDTYICEDRGLEERVDDSNKHDVARYFDAEAKAAKLTDFNFRLDHEYRVAQELMNTSNFTATNSLTAYTEANIATMDFAADVLDLVARLDDKGATPNTIVLNNLVANRIKRSTRFQNFVRGNLPAGQPVLMNNSQIAMAFAEYGIEQVLIGRIAYNSSKKPDTYTASKIWPSTYVWVGEVKGGDPMDGGAGRTFSWTEEGQLFVAESYRSEDRRSQMVRVRQHTDEKVIDTTCGELITTQYS